MQVPNEILGPKFAREINSPQLRASMHLHDDIVVDRQIDKFLKQKCCIYRSIAFHAGPAIQTSTNKYEYYINQKSINFYDMHVLGSITTSFPTRLAN